jgi:hypothetical protein
LPVPPSSLPSTLEQRLVDIPPTTYTDTHANEIVNLDLVGMTRRGRLKVWICIKRIKRFSIACLRRGLCKKMHGFLSVEAIRSMGGVSMALEDRRRDVCFLFLIFFHPRIYPHLLVA